VPGADQYSAWSTDSNGNYVSNIGSNVMSGTSNTLESLEPSFHQDLNGDGVIGLAVYTGATLELVGAASGSVTFISSTGTLKLDTPSTFTGQIFGFTGDGTLAGSDQIDLRGMNYSAVHSSYNNSTGILDVSDGTMTVDLKFAGTYSLANFKFADDGSGGTIVYDPPISGQTSPPGGTANDNTAVAGAGQSTLSVAANQDSFVFAPNFGQVTVANFDPAKDTIQISQSIFANMTALLAATHDDGHGNAVITDVAHDTITIQHVTTTQLLAHQSDFHFV
jgi:serralysin